MKKEANSLKKYPLVTEPRYDRSSKSVEDDRFVPHNPRRMEVEKAEWKDNVPFEAHMVFQTYGRGNSAAYFLFREQGTNIQFPMLLKDFTDMIREGALIQDSKVWGIWQVGKRGTAYGIRWLSSNAEIEKE